MALHDEIPNQRRRLLLSALLAAPVLAACNATSWPQPGDEIVTDAFDGRYEFVISRFRLEPEPDGSAPSLRRLATVTTRAAQGQMSVLSIDDMAQGPNYADFKGFFFFGGRLRVAMTAGYLTGSVGQSELEFDEIVGNKLRAGETVTLQPPGFGDNYAPVIAIRYLGA